MVDHQVTLQLTLALELWERVDAFAGLEAVPLLRGPDVPLGFGPRRAARAWATSRSARACGWSAMRATCSRSACGCVAGSHGGLGPVSRRGQGGGLPTADRRAAAGIVRLSLNLGLCSATPRGWPTRASGASYLGPGLACGCCAAGAARGAARRLRPARLRRARAPESEFLLGAKLRTQAGLTLGAAGGRGFTAASARPTRA